VLSERLAQHVAGLAGIDGAVARPPDQFHMLLELLGIELPLDDILQSADRRQSVSSYVRSE